MNLENLTTDRRLDRVEDAVLRIDKTLERMDNRFDRLESKLDEKFDSLQKQVNGLTWRMTYIMSGLAGGVLLAVVGGIITLLTRTN